MASTPTCDGRPSSLYRPKIEVRGLRYEAGGTEILAGVDALVPAGEVTAFGGGEEHPAARDQPPNRAVLGRGLPRRRVDGLARPASLTLTRIRDDVREQRPKVEAALALGATGRQAASPILKTALQSALIPLIDATKTTGIIFLPGAMVGMIIAGANPLEAVRLQIVVLYMLLGSVSIAAILVGTLSYRSFFTPRHQLRTDPSEQ